MAKGDRDVFMGQYNQQRNQQAGGQNQMMNNLYGQLYGYSSTGQPNQSGMAGLYGAGNQERGNLTGGYGNIANSPYGGLPQDVVQNLRSFQTPQINSGSYAGYQGLAGYNPQFSIDPSLQQG